MRIFVSSTYIDLVEYRKAVERTINRLRQQHLMMEYFGSRPEEPKVAALKEVERCDIFVGIYAHRYGTVPPGDTKSVTEQEFDLAQKLGKPIFAYRVSAKQPWLLEFVEEGDAKKKLAGFLKRVDKLLRSEFTTPEDLAVQVVADLGRYLTHFSTASGATHPPDTPSWLGKVASLQVKITTGDFDVFLCYNSEDRDTVEKIGMWLKEIGILPWLDEWELRPGIPWQAALEEQTKTIKSAAVFVGKNGIGPWQDLEQAAFLREFVKRGCPVIPVILPDCEKTPKLPIFLQSMMWVDFRKQDPDPMKQMIWGITGQRSLPKVSIDKIQPVESPFPQPVSRPRLDLANVNKDFAEHLVATLDKIDATRIVAALDRTLEHITLTEVYVPLRGSVAIPERDVYERAARVAGRKLGDVVGAEEMSRLEQERVATLPLHDALAKYPGLVILGDPGSGKTTFLKYAAVAFAQNAQSSRLGLDAPHVPIFLSIAAYAERLREEKHQLPLADYFARYYRDVHGLADDLAPLFKNALAEGRVAVLLDGLDEVRDSVERARVADQVERFWNYHRTAGNRLVITSRIIGYQRLTADGLTHLTVHDFDDDAIRLFLAQWCPVIERAAEKDSVVAARNAERERRELEDAIFHGSSGVRELVANPLLLTLLALIKRKGVRLPEQRVELYEEYVKALVENWALQRNPDRIITQTRRYAETERVLAALALWMRETNPEAGTVDQAAMEDWLTWRFASPNITPDQARAAARIFVADLRHDLGLVVERGYRIYGFINQTLEEYLAAKGLCYISGTEIEPILTEMRQHHMLTRDTWRETALLTVGHLSVVQRSPDRAAQLVERFLREELSGDARGLNVVRAGEALRDVGEKGITPDAWNATLTALHATMIDAALPPATRRDAGLLLGDLGWLPQGDDALDALVLIPKGKFIYGEGKESKAREIKSDFWIGKYPVTNAQFKRFMDAGGYGDPRKPKPEWWSDAGWKWRTGKPRYDWQKTDQPDDFDDRRWNNPLQPVVGVTWYEAEAYCNWLTMQWRTENKIGAKQVVRLPTDEEWEKTARGLNGSEYAWGNSFDTSKCSTSESKLDTTTPVTMYPNGASRWFDPNGSGVFDLTGNVWECMGSEYQRGSGTFALRGGAWNSNRDGARASFRYNDDPDNSDTNIGFRVVVAQ